MKKFMVLLLVMVFALSSVLTVVAQDTMDKDVKIDKKVKINEKLNKLQNISETKGKALKVEWNQQKGTPSFITGCLSENTVKNDAEVVAYLEEYKQVFGVENGTFKVKKSEKDELGTSHYRTYLEIDGVQVYGTEAIVHIDAQGYVYGINGSVDSEIPAINWSKEFKNSSSKAIDAAVASIGIDKKTAEIKTEKYLYNYKGVWQPVYLVNVMYLNPQPSDWKIFVNASTNKVVDSFNAVTDVATTGTGVGTKGQTRTLNLDLISGKYYMRDLTRKVETYNMNYSADMYSLPGTLMYDTDNNFNSSVQAPAVDAHYYFGVTYDYFKNNHNRNSYNNAGATIKASVHLGSNYNNAYWWNGYFAFGDGDGTQFSPLSGAIDVVAHEFTHAVTQYSCNLEYRDQSGALNESMSDVFGYLVEGVATDWQMGEDVTTPNTAGDALRDLQNPTLYGQPAHMSNYYVTTSDNGGVHTNSGIPNKAFYNAASVINDNVKMGKIYYRAMITYLTAGSQFTDARTALLQATTDLYTSTGTEYTAMANAFTAVGIGGSTPSNDTYEPNGTMTDAYGAIVSATTYNSYIYSNGDNDYYYFNTTAAGTISVTLTNLPGDYDVYLLNSAGTTVASSTNGSTTSESISYTAAAAGKFYVKVIGYNGVYSTSAAYALKATYPNGGSTGQWYYENVSIDTPHNYTDNYNNTYTYTKTGAQKVSVHFSRFETEKSYDFVYIKDKNGVQIGKYDGTLAAFWVEVPGDAINVNLITDSSITAYGYHIDQVAYYSTSQLATGEPVFTNAELVNTK